MNNTSKVYERNETNKDQYSDLIELIEKCNKITQSIKNKLKLKELFNEIYNKSQR